MPTPSSDPQTAGTFARLAVTHRIRADKAEAELVALRATVARLTLALDEANERATTHEAELLRYRAAALAAMRADLAGE